MNLIRKDKIKGKENVRLRAAYLRYTSEISTAEMAASFECVSFLVSVCGLFSARRVLDLGSGFSSFALRQQLSDDKNVRVWSVDDNDAWLRKTIGFLRSERVPIDNVVLLDEFIASGEGDFDVVFLDLNFVEVRRNFIRLVVERCKPKGILIFDDVHKPDFMFDVLSQGKEYGLVFFDIRTWTLDRFGRFALLAIKPA